MCKICGIYVLNNYVWYILKCTFNTHALVYKEKWSLLPGNTPEVAELIMFVVS